MKYVHFMGAVWRMSDRAFVRLAREKRDTGSVENLDLYGKVVIDRLYSLDEVPYAALGHVGDDD
jgi:hypothetical protein